MMNKGNITLITIILSGLILSFGITVTGILTSSYIGITNVSKSTNAYYEAESGAEEGYYLFAGHLAGFEYNYDNDSTCEIETGEDKWCLTSRVNELPVDSNFGLLENNDVLSIGLYNDTSTNPFGVISTSNVDLIHHELSINIFPAVGETDVINNLVGLGDIRITSVVSGSSTYDEKSQVEDGDNDIGHQLENISDSASSCYSDNYLISGKDSIWDSGEFLYRDLDMSRTVSEGDVRMTTVSTYGAGTAVTAGDSDIGTALNKDLLNVGCYQDNNDYLYSTDVAQLVLSGEDDNGNRSIVHVISKNQLMNKTQGSPYSISKSTTANVGNQYNNCSLSEFLQTGDGTGVCLNLGKMKKPQLEIYSFANEINYKVDSTFSDFSINNDTVSCTLCSLIDMEGTSGNSSTYNNSHASDNDVSLPYGATISGAILGIQEYGFGVVSTSSINISGDESGASLALMIQNALNNTAGLKNEYSVNYRNHKFEINSTGITLTNPETTLVSKGIKENFQQSIQTSITDSSLVPIFGWYSVF